MTDLLEIVGKIPTTAFSEEGGLTKFLDSVDVLVEKTKFDIETASGRAGTRTFSRTISKCKASLEKKKLLATESLRTEVSRVNKAGNEMSDRLAKARDKARQPLTDREDVEKERIEKLQGKINGLKAYVLDLDVGIDLLKDYLGQVKAVVIDDTWGEFAQEGGIVKADVEERLGAKITVLEEQARKDAELESLQTEAAERAEDDRLQAILKEAEETARINAKAETDAAVKKVEDEKRDAILEKEAAEQAVVQAEQDAKDAAKKAELKAEAAVAQSKKDAEFAALRERENIENENRAEVAAEAKRKADKEHRRNINQSALSGLTSAGLSEADAKKAIEAIAQGYVPHVKIQY